MPWNSTAEGISKDPTLRVMYVEISYHISTLYINIYVYICDTYTMRYIYIYLPTHTHTRHTHVPSKVERI